MTIYAKVSQIFSFSNNIVCFSLCTVSSRVPSQLSSPPEVPVRHTSSSWALQTPYFQDDKKSLGSVSAALSSGISEQNTTSGCHLHPSLTLVEGRQQSRPTDLLTTDLILGLSLCTAAAMFCCHYLPLSDPEISSGPTFCPLTASWGLPAPSNSSSSFYFLLQSFLPLSISTVSTCKGLSI